MIILIINRYKLFLLLGLITFFASCAVHHPSISNVFDSKRMNYKRVPDKTETFLPTMEHKAEDRLEGVSRQIIKEELSGDGIHLREVSTQIFQEELDKEEALPTTGVNEVQLDKQSTSAPLTMPKKMDERDKDPWSTFAIMAFISAFFVPVLPIVFGILALREIRSSPTPMRGTTLAIIAIVYGTITLLYLLALIAYFALLLLII